MPAQSQEAFLCTIFGFFAAAEGYEQIPVERRAQLFE
jgi:hypothetical protein